MDLRKVERKSEGRWYVCELKDIMEGDTFRMFTFEGDSPVIGVGKDFEFKALSNAVTDQEGVVTVRFEDVIRSRDKSLGLKRAFLDLIDGTGGEDYGFPPKYPGVTSFTLGICKLDVAGGTLHVYLRRPGLLIGRMGELVGKIRSDLGCEIHLHEVNLLGD